MTYFKNLGIEDEEIILNCIKRELFLEDFAKHENDKTSEEFIKSEIALEIDKLKKQNEILEKDLTDKEVEKNNIIKEKEQISEEKKITVSKLKTTVNQKDTAITSLEDRLQILEDEKERNKDEKERERLFINLERKKTKWEISKANFINKKLKEEIPKLRNSVKYFLFISVITLLPLLITILLKANKKMSDWVESLEQKQWLIWGTLIMIQMVEILGRSYLFDKEKIKNGWQWLRAFFDKSIDEKVMKIKMENFEKDFIKEYGNKPE